MDLGRKARVLLEELLLAFGKHLHVGRGGFGVGLYLARQLVERMGGQIWLDNKSMRGNSFFIAVPLEEPS